MIVLSRQGVCPCGQTALLVVSDNIKELPCMKIALITPCYYPFVRGNSVTVRRIEKFIQANDCEVRVFSLDIVTAEDTLKDMKKFGPDIIHAFHGYVGGRIARLISKILLRWRPTGLSAMTHSKPAAHSSS